MDVLFARTHAACRRRAVTPRRAARLATQLDPVLYVGTKEKRFLPSPPQQTKYSHGDTLEL